jgi:hypothetical protein
MRRRVEREVIQRRDIIFIHAVAERRDIRKSRNQHAGERAESDIYYVVVRPAAAEWPTGVVAAQWAEAVLLRQRSRGNGKVDARDVRYINTQQIVAGRRRDFETENAIQNAAGKERIADVLGELLIIGRLTAVPVVFHGKRNKRFHCQRIPYAVHLNEVAKVEGICRGRAHGDLLTKRRGPSADLGVGGSRIGGHAAIGRHSGDGQLEGNQADVVTCEAIDSVGILWPGAGISGSREN